MLGKLDEDFPKSEARDFGETRAEDKSQERKYDYQVCFIEKMRKINPRLSNLIEKTWIVPSLKSISDISETNELSLFLFSKNYTNSNNIISILKLLFDSHGIASGIEKGIAMEEEKQFISETFISTAFGYEYSNVIRNDWSNLQKNVYTTLQETLDMIKNSNMTLSEENWWNCLKELRSDFENSFRQTVGDTRRPLNHISLFDQTVSTVAFYKAELARVVLEVWKEPKTRNFRKKYKFRLLRLTHNGIRFWGETDTIGDLFSRKSLIDSVILGIERLLTCKYPLGYLAYKDENDAVFLIPDKPTDILALTDDNQRCEDLIKGESSRITDGEIIPALLIGGESRWAANLGSILEKKDEPEIDITRIAGLWKGKSEEICTVCGIRPLGDDKAKRRKICNTCLKRRENRSRTWSEDLKTTIWIDEISDINGRIALIVGKFDIKDWINGKLVNTLLGRLLPSVSSEWKLNEHTFKKITEEVEKELSQTKIDSTNYVNKLIPEKTSIRKGLKPENSVKELYNLLTIEREGGFPLEDPPSTKNAELLFQAIFAQETSFARIRRIWETTRQFWQDILPADRDILQSKAGQIIGKRGPRLLIKGDVVPHGNNPLGPYHAYELILPGTKMSVVWDREHQGFIIADNLAYIAKLLGKVPEKINKKDKDYEKQMSEWATHEMKRIIKDTLDIEEPLGYGARDKKQGSITATEVTDVGSEYIPVIPILAEPSTFMALVPADRAIEVVKAIKEKYEREMGKVKNRLPLTLGIIFAHQYTPLRIIIDAGQRMLAKSSSSRWVWKITEKPQCNSTSGDPHFTKTICMQLENESDKIRWKVPLCMGDGKTDDHWYPYAFLGEYGQNQDPETRKRSLKAPCPQNNDQLTWLVHAEDLSEGDTIYFTPSFFDFEWLDTSSRRFEIAYENGIRLGEKDIKRPYFLDNFDVLEDIWNTLKETLTTTQIHALRDLIEQKKKEWNVTKQDCVSGSVFWQFCRDALATSQWGKDPWGITENKNKKTWLDEWADYAVRGWLTDALEIYMQIMKEKSEIGGG